MPLSHDPDRGSTAVLLQQGSMSCVLRTLGRTGVGKLEWEVADKLLPGITENPGYWKRLEWQKLPQFLWWGSRTGNTVQPTGTVPEEVEILERFCPQNMSSLFCSFLLVFSSVLCLPCPCADNYDAMWNTMWPHWASAHIVGKEWYAVLSSWKSFCPELLSYWSWLHWALHFFSTTLEYLVPFFCFISIWTHVFPKSSLHSFANKLSRLPWRSTFC